MTDPVLRVQALRGRRFGAPLPDGLMAVVFALAAAVEFVPQQVLEGVPATLLASRHELVSVLVVEVVFLFMQGTLVDIATRIRKRPPVWLAALILIGVVLFSNEARSMVMAAWEQGLPVFVPLALSLAQRCSILWTMPDRTPIEKLAARALIANRITTAIGVMAVTCVVWLAGDPTSSWPALVAGAIYFGIAAFDDWRVRGQRFADNPAVLFRFDPIGVTYRAPL